MSGKTPLTQLPLPQALAVLALDYLAEARAAANRLRDPADEEALHDLRVALRRLHSLLRSYDDDLAWLPAKQRKAVRRLARASNPARDAEVQLVWLQQHDKGLRESQQIGYDWLIAELQPKSDGTLLRTLRDGVARLHKKLRPLFKPLARDGASGPLFAEAAAARAQPQVDEVCRALADIRAAQDVGSAHEARIAVKRLRYLLTPLRGQGPACQQTIVLLRRLQDLLGDLHDRHVLEQLLDDSVAGLAAAQAREAFERMRRAVTPARDWQPPQLPGLLAIARRNEAAMTALYETLQQEFLQNPEVTVCTALRAAVDELHKAQ